MITNCEAAGLVIVAVLVLLLVMITMFYAGYRAGIKTMAKE